MMEFKKVGIIGAGSYGTAIAQCFSVKAQEVVLISRSESVAESINKLHVNIKSLPGIGLSEKIVAEDNFSSALSCDIIFIAVPVTAVKSVCKQIKECKIEVPVVLCSKGFDTEKSRLLSTMVEEILDNEILFFSGPSFACEIAKGLPAGVNIAGKNRQLADKVAKSFSTALFEVRAIDDYIGLQVAGAMKNILAVGCGILSGLKLGNSAISRLIIEGLREMMELTVVLGGKKETFLELGGVGDIILTCTSNQSRNVQFGEYISSGGLLKGWRGSLCEGAFTAKAIPMLAKKHKLKFTVFSEIYKAIYKNKCLLEIVSEIMKP